MSTGTASEPRIAPHECLRTRLNARLRSRQLDQSLARGTPPETAAPLALRARRLTTLAHRRAVADGLRRAVRESCRGVSASLARVAPHRSQVITASDELIRLADALAAPGPVAARGVAQARILLTDGAGPLYTMRGNLRARAASAADNLPLGN
jgi:hypothetical protein